MRTVPRDAYRIPIDSDDTTSLRIWGCTPEEIAGLVALKADCQRNITGDSNHRTAQLRKLEFARYLTQRGIFNDN